MDVDPPAPPTSAKKKTKFKPKAPPRRKTGSVLPKIDDSDHVDEDDRELLRKFNERRTRRVPKVEKKSSDNITTSHEGGSSSTPFNPKDLSSKNIPNFRETAQKTIIIPSSIATKDEMLIDDEFKSSRKSKKEYKEPWDPLSYYPVTLPWRPPGSGNPEILNAQEFGEEKEYDETKINSASELGLSEQNDEKQMFMFKFPPKLPLDKQTRRIPVSAKGKEKVESSSSLKEDASTKLSDLNELPNGYIGKMLVYKSGKIKFKLGDIVFDVSSGILDECAQDVAVMNTNSKDCCVVGQVDKQAVLVPDLDSILDNMNC